MSLLVRPYCSLGFLDLFGFGPLPFEMQSFVNDDIELFLEVISVDEEIKYENILHKTSKLKREILNRIFVTKMSVIDLGMYGGRACGRAAIKCFPCINS